MEGKARVDSVKKGEARLARTPADEARRVIEEYINDLRELVKKLRQRMN